MSANNIKLAVAVVVLLAAGTIYHFTSDPASNDSGDDTKTEWYCTACNKPFVLTAAELAKSMRLAEREVKKESGPTDAPQARGRGNVTTVNIAKCPFCKEWHGEAARTCAKCGEIFPAKTKEGEPTVCPKCGWDPHKS
jgi:hypothetical protein